MNFDQLPNELQALVLTKLSLHEQLRLREVCTHWRMLIEEKFLQRRSLKIFHSIMEVAVYCSEVWNTKPKDEFNFWALKPEGADDDLIINSRHFTPDCAIEMLGRLFPNLEHLILYKHCRPHVTENQYFEHSHSLLRKYRTSLISFSLFGFYTYLDFAKVPAVTKINDKVLGGKIIWRNDGFPEHATDVQQCPIYTCVWKYPVPPQACHLAIAEELNSMSNLKRLELRVVDMSYQVAFMLEPTLLQRLEQFAVHEDSDWDRPHDLRCTMAYQYASLGPNCTRLRVPFDDLLAADGTTLTCPSLSSSLTSLTTPISDQLSIMCDQLPELQHLDLHLNRTATFKAHIERSMLLMLSRLHKLTDLCLNGICFRNIAQAPVPGDKVLTSVTRLTLKYCSISAGLGSFDVTAFYERLAAWFPNLQHLIIHSRDSEMLRILERNVHLIALISHRFYQYPSQDETNRFYGCWTAIENTATVYPSLVYAGRHTYTIKNCRHSEVSPVPIYHAFDIKFNCLQNQQVCNSIYYHCPVGRFSSENLLWSSHLWQQYM